VRSRSGRGREGNKEREGEGDAMIGIIPQTL
jgi:hypothetical protein